MALCAGQKTDQAALPQQRALGFESVDNPGNRDGTGLGERDTVPGAPAPRRIHPHHSEGGRGLLSRLKAGATSPANRMADRFPPHINMDTPSIARMYDYLLGGKDNFEADRKACEELAAGVPELVTLSRDNRAFLGRAVEYVSGQGVEQFLDLGAGLPTSETTHHFAQRTNPGARVVYVDHDPIVLAHGRALVTDSTGTAFLDADVRDTARILDSRESQQLLDLDLPVCVMMLSLLHCLPDDSDPFGLARSFVDRLAPGSCLVFSHIVADDPGAATWMTDKIHSFGTPWGRVRGPAEAAAAFTGLVPVSPWNDGRDGGPELVDCATWRNPEADPRGRPADAEAKLWTAAGIAFKR